MAIEEVHLYDIGTIFEITLYDDTVIVDVSGATVKSVLLTDASGTTVVHAADFKTDGTDGIIQYTTIADDLSVAGKWKIQGRVTLPTGTWSSDVSTFKVYPNLD